MSAASISVSERRPASTPSAPFVADLPHSPRLGSLGILLGAAIMKFRQLPALQQGSKLPQEGRP
jgi:hypothetical protein